MSRGASVATCCAPHPAVSAWVPYHLPQPSVRIRACEPRSGRGERSGADAFQLTYEIAPAAGMRLEVA
jgi:hypothetical protein